jgi:putative hydroxymethylpyrimidine transporter CytX
MSTSDRLKRIGTGSTSWDLTPVPGDLRRLSGTDLAVLWGDLAVGILVLAAGALLVPALSLPQALAAIVIGSVLGCIPLALVGLAGAREGVPGMVLFRPILGIRGSWVPSVMNLVQLVGWTALELWAMGRVANAVSKELLGLDAYLLWLALIALLCTALALGGPVLVVRRWLERFGVWVVAAVGLWLSWRLVTVVDLQQVWQRPGEGGWPGFASAVDLVIAMAVSWLPLVADYNRFSSNGRSSAAGTFIGFFIGNAWFFALGAMLVLVAGASPDAQGIGVSITTLAGGAFLLLVLLVVETDEAFANIYSAAVSFQNLMPRAPQPLLILAVAGVGTVLAAVLSMDAYQYFLLLIGSVFVPLFGVFFARYFLLGDRGFDEGALFATTGRYWFRGGFRWVATVPWVAGFVVYQGSVPTGPGWWTSAVESAAGSVGLESPLFDPVLGASVPSFAVAFGLTLLFGLVSWARAARRPP